MKIQDKLLRKIFLAAVFFLAIFLLGFFVSELFHIPISTGDTSLKDYCAEFGQLSCFLIWIKGFLGYLGIIGFLLLITGLILSSIKIIKKKKAPRNLE